MEEKTITEVVEETTVTPTDGGKTYTEAELKAEAEKMAKQLANGFVSDRINEVKNKAEQEKKEAIEKALKEAQMSESEKVMAELEALRQKNAEWEEKYTRKEKSEDIVKRLTSAKIPVDDTIVETLINSYDNADKIIETLSNNIKSMVDREVEEKLKSSGNKIQKGEEINPQPVRSTNMFRTPAARIGAVTK